MNGKWTSILRAQGQGDLGAALVQLARQAADLHLASIVSPAPVEAGDALPSLPSQWPAEWRKLVQEPRS